MKILCTGDLHLRESAPINRIDDYFKTQAEKITFILELAISEKCNCIVFPGDVFDSARASHYLTQYYIKMFLSYDIKKYCISGQHDMRYHNQSTENTPLNVLSASQSVLFIDQSRKLSRKQCVYLYGASFNQDIPKIIDDDCINILAIHRMIINKDKLYQSQSDYIDARVLLKRHDFDLIISGDNHNSFIVMQDDKFLINCGSLMRSNINQVDHKPYVVIFDTDEMRYDKIFIPVRDDVFNHDAIERKIFDDSIDPFIKSLQENRVEHTLDYVANVYAYVKDNKISNSVVDIIDEVMEKIA